jgi:hypothetical protein
MNDVTRNDALSEFEHSHTRINGLVLRLVEAVTTIGSPARTSECQRSLARLLEEIRDELLVHFAREEEGLFPFIRLHVPEHLGTVARLEATHDLICGALTRLGDLASKNMEESLVFILLHERFESAYAEHGREEKALLSDLARGLDEQQRVALRELVHGL